MKSKIDLPDFSDARICICGGLLVASMPFLAIFFLDLVGGLLATVFIRLQGAFLLSAFVFVPLGLGLALVCVIGLLQK